MGEAERATTASRVALVPASRSLLGVLVAVVCTLCACSDGAAPDAPEAAAPTATPLGEYDAGSAAVQRAAFCDLVGDDAVERALGGPAESTDSWEPGTELPSSSDIGNEYGCSWTRGEESVAGWVLAPPVSAQRAADFAAEVVTKRCRRAAGAADLGSPSVTVQCGDAEVRVAGLVGDAWVTCASTRSGVERADRVDAAGEWCVDVVEAMAAR